MSLITTLAREMGREVSVGAVPVWLAKLGATVTGWFRKGGMTPAVIDVITSDETVRDNADAELGVSLTPLSETLRRMVEERAGT